jgi:hypothetical protein
MRELRMNVKLIKKTTDFKLYKALENITVTLQCDYPNPTPEINPHNLIKVFIKKGDNFTITSFLESLGVNEFNVQKNGGQEDA